MLDMCSKCGNLVDTDGYDPKRHGPVVLCGVNRCLAEEKRQKLARLPSEWGKDKK